MSWNNDHNTQKKVYTGYVRPVLEYGIATWGTAAKSHFDKVKRIQNKAAKLITVGKKSTLFFKVNSKVNSIGTPSNNIANRNFFPIIPVILCQF